MLKFCRLCDTQIQKRKKGKSVVFGAEPDEKANELIRTNGIRGISKLTCKEKNLRLLYWIRESQRKTFPNEYEASSKQKPVSRNSRLWQLSWV